MYVRGIMMLNAPKGLIGMRIRDRGMLKFLPAHFAPEHRTLLRELARDELRQPKPLLDEYEIENMESTICYAMEFTYHVVITKWADGFTYEEKGLVHYLDPIAKEVRIVSDDGSVVRMKFADIIAVEVIGEGS